MAARAARQLKVDVMGKCVGVLTAQNAAPT